MKKIIVFIWFFLLCTFSSKSQQESTPDFTWGNTAYFNLNIGERIWYCQKEIKLLATNNQCNTIKVADDTLVVKVCQRSLPLTVDDLRIFVADNKNVRSLTDDFPEHGLLRKDALIAVNNTVNPLLNENDYVFPVNFNDGFIWRFEENNHIFSFIKTDQGGEKYKTYDGIDFDMRDSKGEEKHWIVAIENSKVVQLWENRDDEDRNQVSLLLESESQPGIFYFYGNLYRKTLMVRKGQKLVRDEIIGTAWGNDEWGFVHFSVLKNDTVPEFEDVNANIINFFPQLYELYFNRLYGFSKLFSKGTVRFGGKNAISGNEENNLAFEEYVGKGWLLGCWDASDEVPFVTKNDQGNVRLNKILFAGSGGESVNPENYYDYEINVRDGSYRIRAKVGDVELATWQKVEFENIDEGEFSLEKGEQEWTDERIVKVNDGKLTIRIYIDPGNKPAGLSEIVFQRAM